MVGICLGWVDRVVWIYGGLGLVWYEGDLVGKALVGKDNLRFWGLLGW